MGNLSQPPDNLEHIIENSILPQPESPAGQAPYPSSQPGRWRQSLADLTANLSFSLAYGPFVDMYISRLTWEEMLSTRAVMVPVTALASDYYGRFMDYCFSRWGITNESPFIDKCKGDTATCAMFWAPLYTGVVMANGATLADGFIAFGYTALMAAPVGIMVNNWMRHLRTCFGAASQQSLAEHRSIQNNRTTQS